MEELVKIMKDSMRISHEKLDAEISRKIRSCKEDLKIHGVNADWESELIVTACEFYCKWQFDHMNAGEDFHRYYEDLRDHLSMTSDFRLPGGVADEGTK